MCTIEGSLRRFTPADYGTLIEWLPTADALRLFTGPRLSWPLTIEQLDALERDPGRTAWTLEFPNERGVPVGHVELVASGIGYARLARVIIAPAARGHGYGLLIVRLALEKARQFGALRVGLNVLRDNGSAIAIYCRLGFADVPPPADRTEIRSMELVLDSGASADQS